MNNAYLLCTTCGKAVSTPLPAGTVVRAAVTCPECIKNSPDELDLVEKQKAAMRASLQPVYEWLCGQDFIAKSEVKPLVSLLKRVHPATTWDLARQHYGGHVTPNCITDYHRRICEEVDRALEDAKSKGLCE